MKTWKVTFAALLCAALAVAAQAQTKVVNYSYDAAGNRTGRVTATLPEQQSAPAETARPSSMAPQKSSSAGASASAGNRTSGSSEATGSQTDGNPETMPAKEETPAEAPSEKREGRQ